MVSYTNYCTEDQAFKAWKLGAPLVEVGLDYYLNDKIPTIKVVCDFYLVPTTQQFNTWLFKNKHLFISIKPSLNGAFIGELLDLTRKDTNNNFICINTIYNSDPNETMRLVIDNTLNYLENNK